MHGTRSQQLSPCRSDLSRDRNIAACRRSALFRRRRSRIVERSTMRFRSYPRIGGNAGSMPGPWVRSEKIPGANFVVGVERAAVRCGKRRQWLDDAAPFFGWQLIAGELGERCRALASELGAPHVVCYGELYGGGYPHADVPAIPGM